MIRSRLRHCLLLLLSVLVLLPRVGGPHLHLCLGGSGPAVTVHLDDDAAPPGSEGQVHDDRTFEIGSPVLGKSWPPGLDGALLLVVAVLLFATGQAVLRPARAAPPFHLPPPFLRPPLRGPPA
jgi:hypothetical protein